MTSVTIGNSVTSIGKEAFYRCSGLTSVNIPNSVTSIGESAFIITSIKEIHITDITSWCTTKFSDFTFPSNNKLYLNGEDIKELEIPESVTEIGTCSFKYCSDITSVKVHWTRPLAGGADSFLGTVKKNATLYVPKGTATMYMSAPGWIEFANIVEYDEESAINRIETTSDTDADWYTLDGRKLEGEPTEKGVYINDGKKVYVK